MTNKALGRGLSALIPEKESAAETKDVVLQLPISHIRTSKYQPRTDFNEEKLNQGEGSCAAGFGPQDPGRL